MTSAFRWYIVAAMAVTTLCASCGTEPTEPAPRTATSTAPTTTEITTTVVAPAPVTTTRAPQPAVPPVATPKPVATTTKPATGYYANCDAARAAGAAPLHAGEPGYRAALDRDKDGVACE